MEEYGSGSNTPLPATKARGRPALHHHPSPQELEQFLRGELDRADNRRIVRHLLTGCATCAAFTAPIFRFAEAPLVRPRARARKTR
jgi:hypothetical protein